MNPFSRNINRVTNQWRRKKERKRLMRPYPARAPLASEMRESKPATAETAS